MDRAYSVLHVKTIDEEQRIIRGIATTPETDRTGDQVMPEGVQFKNPTPLLWQHQHDKPVGTVRFNTPTKAGITFEAQLPVIREPGVLKDRVDEAWQSVKAGLITAVSIGFRALDGQVERLKGGGLKFNSIELLELSLVSVPAHSGALITAIKSLDHDSLTQQREKAVEIESPPASVGATPPAAKPRGAVKLIPRKQQ